MTYLQKIRRLYGIDESKSFGFKKSDIEQVEKRLNFLFPQALRAYYLTLGKNTKLNAFNRLLSPKGGVDFSEDRYLVFYEENQAVAYWAIKEEELGVDNPCVYGNYGTASLNGGWLVDNLTIENFLLSMALWNGVLGGLKYNANALNTSALTESVWGKVVSNWTELPGITNQQVRYFTNDFTDVIAFTTDLNSTINGVFIGSNNKAAYQKIIDTLGIDWDYRADRDG